jgi:hypothetical protein
MRCISRIACAAVILIAPILSACDTLDSFEFFDTKKKLAGERKPVFPEGVPGVTAGVPAEMMKGYKEPEGQVAADPATAAAEAAAESEATVKPKAKPQPKPQQTASRPPPRRVVAAPAAAAPATTAPPTAAPAPAAPVSATTARASTPLPSAPLPWPSAAPQAAWPASPPTATQ